MWMRRWMCIRPSCCRCRIIEDNPLLGACCVNWYYFSLQSWKWKCLDHVKYWCIGWCVCFKGWLDNMVFQFSWQRYRISSLVYLLCLFAVFPLNPLWFEENGNVKMMERSVWFSTTPRVTSYHVVWAMKSTLLAESRLLLLELTLWLIKSSLWRMKSRLRLLKLTLWLMKWRLSIRNNVLQ